jgi:hypothetical protein
MNYNLKINKLYCDHYLKKNGKIIFIPKIYDRYLCMINNINLLDFVKFPYLYDKNEDKILKKLFILYILQKKNFKYIKIDNSINKDKNYILYLFDESKTNIVLEILFLDNIIKNNKIYNYYYGTMLKSLCTGFMLNKLMYDKSDKKTLIILFYTLYINLIQNEIYDKYNKKLNDFKNYSDLYIFLKKYGYVTKYYDDYGIKMIQNYNKFYKKIVNHPKLKKFKDEYSKEIKNFKDINLIKIIDKYVNNDFNKEYIKNKFIELTEKYNI